ncbi:MAG: thrombospondin type 3 repeat-containing protein [bacterium]
MDQGPAAAAAAAVGGGGGGGMGGGGGSGGGGGDIGGGGGGVGGAGGGVEGDADGDGVPDVLDNCKSEPNPGQQDKDRDGIGDHCESCNEDAECVVVTYRCEIERTCRSARLGHYERGRCIAGTCGEFADAGGSLSYCRQDELCAFVDGEAACVPDDICIEELPCRLETEGQICGNPETPSRCVTGVCEPWTCLDVHCNENGPRLGRPPPPEQGLRLEVIDPVTIRDMRTGILWSLETGAVGDLAGAHRYCDDVSMRRGGVWRVPTWYELHGVSGRTQARREARTAVAWPLFADRTFISRTRVDLNRAMGVNLAIGTGEAVPLIAVGDGYLVHCVSAPAQVEDLSARRAAFDTPDADGPVDPWTELTWVAGLLNAGFSLRVAETDCGLEGASLPTVEEAISLLTYNVADPPGPGYWPDWDGLAFGRRAARIWTSEPVEVEGGFNVGWVVDLGTGAVVREGVGAPAGYICVTRPR